MRRRAAQANPGPKPNPKPKPKPNPNPKPNPKNKPNPNPNELRRAECARTAESLAAERGATELAARLEAQLEAQRGAVLQAAHEGQAPLLHALAEAEAERRRLCAHATAEQAERQAERRRLEQCAAVLRERLEAAEQSNAQLAQGLQHERAESEALRQRWRGRWRGRWIGGWPLRSREVGPLTLGPAQAQAQGARGVQRRSDRLYLLTYLSLRRQQLASKAIALHGLEEAARRMEAELRGHGLLPEGQSVVDGTAPLYYLTAPPPESTPAFRYSCLGQERYLQRYVPLPAVPASPPRHLDLAPGDA